MIKYVRPAATTIAVALIAGTLGAGRFASAGEPALHVPAKCEVPADLVPDTLPLPNAARLVQTEHRLKIVALGSSSTLGLGGSDPQTAWPARLEVLLTERLPGTDMRVVNRGVARQSAQQMLDRLDTDVLAEKPGLVIWESGAAEAVRGADIDEFSDALLSGIDRMTAAGIDVILMDTQYSRSTAQLINFQPYVTAIEQVAGMRGLARFPRYSMMRYWADDDRFSFAGKSATEARKTADQIYDCLGQLLAVDVVRGLTVK